MTSCPKSHSIKQDTSHKPQPQAGHNDLYVTNYSEISVRGACYRLPLVELVVALLLLRCWLLALTLTLTLYCFTALLISTSWLPPLYRGSRQQLSSARRYTIAMHTPGDGIVTRERLRFAVRQQPVDSMSPRALAHACAQLPPRVRALRHATLRSPPRQCRWHPRVQIRWRH